MQKFGQTLITDAGKSMLTAVDGAQGRIIYTKAILSTQDISTLGDDKVRALAALSDDKLDTAINVITVQTDTVTVGASFNNATVTQDILFNSIGWYAKTTVDNVEHLLAVTPSLTEQTLIASTNGESSASVEIELAMARGHNTTVTVSPIAVGLIDNTQLQSAVNASHNDLATKIATKANTDDVDNALATKANTNDVNTALALKADSTSVYDKADADDKFANKSDTNNALATKANTNDVSSLQQSLDNSGATNLVYNSEYDNNADGWNTFEICYLPNEPLSMYNGSQGLRGDISGKGADGLTQFGESKRCDVSMFSTGLLFSFSAMVKIFDHSPEASVDVCLAFFDSSGNRIGWQDIWLHTDISDPNSTTWQKASFDGFAQSTGAATMAIQYLVHGDTMHAVVAQPIITQTSANVPYHADTANVKGDISTLKQTATQNTSDIASAKGDISTLKQNVQSIPRYAENVVLNSYVPMATYNGNAICPVRLSVGPRLDGKKVTIQLTYHVTRYNSTGDGFLNSDFGFNNVQMKNPDYTNIWYTLLNDGDKDGFNITQTGTFTLANTIIWGNARTDGIAPQNNVILAIYNSDFDAEFWLKIAVWRDVNTPPDMTWLPSVADEYAIYWQLQALQAKVDSMSR